jgi:hypothetical protein
MKLKEVRMSESISKNIFLSAKDLNFDLNNTGRGIFHSGSYGTNTIIKIQVENGNSVELKKGDIHIKVDNIKQNSDGSYNGFVKYVSPYESLLKDDIKEGTIINFLYDYIFYCSH